MPVQVDPVIPAVVASANAASVTAARAFREVVGVPASHVMPPYGRAFDSELDRLKRKFILEIHLRFLLLCTQCVVDCTGPNGRAMPRA